MTVFEARSYTSFVQEIIRQNAGTRGYQGRLAKAAGVHGSYFSRMLTGAVHLTPDQAQGLASFWGMNDDESECLLQLVHQARAATLAYRRAIERRLEQLRRNATDLARRFQASFVPGDQEQQIYFSAWHFAAVHMALTIPSLRTESAIAKCLGLSPSFVSYVFGVLEGLGLAKRATKGWLPGSHDVHVSSQAAFAPVQHANIRVHTAAVVHDRAPEALHYSGMHTLSSEDFNRLRIHFTETIAQARKRIEKSSEEELVCFCLDWYRMGRG